MFCHHPKSIKCRSYKLFHDLRTPVVHMVPQTRSDGWLLDNWFKCSPHISYLGLSCKFMNLYSIFYPSFKNYSDLHFSDLTSS